MNWLNNIFGFNTVDNCPPQQQMNQLQNHYGNGVYNQNNLAYLQSIQGYQNQYNLETPEPRVSGPKVSDLEKYPALKNAWEEVQTIMKLVGAE